MRVLFLDFDGVLHPLGLRLEGNRVVNGKPVAKVIQVDFFCWNALLMNILQDHPDVKLVVHSSWRDYHTPEAIRDYLGPQLGSRFLGCTQEGFKYESICQWLTGHPEVTTYRILDDDVASFDREPAVQGFIACEYRSGIAAAGVRAQLDDWLASGLGPSST